MEAETKEKGPKKKNSSKEPRNAKYHPLLNYKSLEGGRDGRKRRLEKKNSIGGGRTQIASADSTNRS